MPVSISESLEVQMARRILDIVLIISGLLVFAFQVYELCMNLVAFPDERIMKGFRVINIAVGTVFLFILTRKALFLLAHIISALDLFMLLLNQLLFNTFCHLGKLYIDNIVKNEKLVDFAYGSAVNSASFILVTLIAVLTLLWLKYISVVYHRLKDLGEG